MDVHLQQELLASVVYIDLIDPNLFQKRLSKYDAIQNHKKFEVYDVTIQSTIYSNCISELIKLDELFESSCSKVKLSSNDNNRTIICSPAHSWGWLKTLPLATDCHSFNLKLILEPNGFVLQTKEKIQPYDKLTLWFSHNLLSILQIPFLLPTNIRGEKQYICHKCDYECETPNPLKIHLALQCGKQPQKELWNRLKINNPINFSLMKIPVSSNFSSELSSELKNIQQISSNEINQISAVRKKISTQNSAFKPYVNREKSSKFLKLPGKTEIFNLNNNKSNLSERNVLLSTQLVIQSSLESHKLNSGTNFNYEEVTKIMNEKAAQMETIVSNLGRIKDGHLCIYCGKLYSRKYGLKIHIRTHTGFKPLKCKYCMRAFGDPSNLNKHVRLHSEAGDTPYRCELCNKILVRKRDLERHIKSRH